jgi:hypothetical protein
VTDVNTKIQEQNQQSGIHHLPSINEIEIIEIHRHKVIQAGRLIHKIRYEKSFQHLDYNNQIKKVSGARMKYPMNLIQIGGIASKYLSKTSCRKKILAILHLWYSLQSRTNPMQKKKSYQQILT